MSTIATLQVTFPDPVIAAVIIDVGAPGPAGADGAQGPAGADGAAGAQGPAGTYAIVSVLNDVARFALDSATAPNGSIVRVSSTGQDYIVVDQTALSSETGYSNLNPAGPAVIQLRRGTTAEILAMTPAEGEPLWDTTKGELRVGDGTSAGGLVQSVLRITDAARLAAIWPVGTLLFVTDVNEFWIGDGATLGGTIIGSIPQTLVPYNPTSVVAVSLDSQAQFGAIPIVKTSLGGTGTVGNVGTNIQRAILVGQSVGGSNHATGTGNGGNAGTSSQLGTTFCFEIRTGFGGDAGEFANGGAGGALGGATGVLGYSTAGGVFAIRAGNGGAGNQSGGTGSGGAGGRMGTILLVGGAGGVGGATAAGGAGGDGPNVAGGSVTRAAIVIASGTGGAGADAVGGAGGRFGFISLTGGKGGDASGSTAGAAGGSAGAFTANGTNASGATAGLDAGFCNLNAGASYAGGILDLSNGQQILTIRGVAGLLTHRVAVPASSAAAGLPGQWASDDTYIYYYGATQWYRIAGATW